MLIETLLKSFINKTKSLVLENESLFKKTNSYTEFLSNLDSFKIGIKTKTIKTKDLDFLSIFEKCENDYDIILKIELIIKEKKSILKNEKHKHLYNILKFVKKNTFLFLDPKKTYCLNKDKVYVSISKDMFDYIKT